MRTKELRIISCMWDNCECELTNTTLRSWYSFSSDRTYAYTEMWTYTNDIALAYSRARWSNNIHPYSHVYDYLTKLSVVSVNTQHRTLFILGITAFLVEQFMNDFDWLLSSFWITLITTWYWFSFAELGNCWMVFENLKGYWQFAKHWLG